MAININVKVQHGIKEYAAKFKRRNHTLVRTGIALLAKEIKEDIYRDQDTQTGRVRQRKFDVGGVVAPSGSLITGSTPSENPNIETAKLVDSIRAQKAFSPNPIGYVIAEADNGSYDYAVAINERNRFLQRGYLRQKNQLIELAKIIHTQSNV